MMHKLIIRVTVRNDASHPVDLFIHFETTHSRHKVFRTNEILKSLHGNHPKHLRTHVTYFLLCTSNFKSQFLFNYLGNDDILSYELVSDTLIIIR